MATTLAKRMREAYAKTRESWGGATLHWGDLEWVPDGIDAYAVTVKPEGVETISISENAGVSEFKKAFMAAWGTFQAEWLGIFHDDDKHTIDFDPVVVVASAYEVDQIHKTHPVVGGAYHFATGNGYWPDDQFDEYPR